MVSGAGAYYFAKRDINAHRREQEWKGLGGSEFLTCNSHVRAPNLRSKEQLGKDFEFCKSGTDWSVGDQVVERGEAAKVAQEERLKKGPRQRRSHDDKLG
jgi:Domain of unknown function (DUF4748)